MIPFDFKYYRPETLEEAIELYREVKKQGAKPMYYGGGTEFISMARMHNVYSDAIIDIKGIPECNVHEIRDDRLYLGAALTLTQIAELNFFPLLSLTIERIADHTIQGKITLGGNLAGTIIYREAILPLLVAESNVVLAGYSGIHTVPLKDVFQEKLLLSEGDMILQVIVGKEFLSLPYFHVKRTKYEKIDYPLITASALQKNKNIQIAFSGLCDSPFRSILVEEILNNGDYSFQEKIRRVLENIPAPILEDVSGSSEYRKFVVQQILQDVLKRFEVSHP
ncbi:FAD binding domain-containing protein [Alkaliphilus oremlandii]|uniref:Molybdopterin dehydrogenase FAD-binding n=1 Tax=Alkaliphilus oremlandii (strain OhILAs) TaxID=350688 RepID=A8ML09_ALKOO|nr:FAD binding domain-containing protein [Alkaliphilus oremlandii]ABW17826.1 molybdopterin dehydrogenase FAD-binding [Alkaliphilus oremlandii OhILAs]